MLSHREYSRKNSSLSFAPLIPYLVKSMIYIYMNNYRGFSRTVLPIERATFLVGENSTGKSSFLKLINLFSQPQFWYSPSEAFYEEAEMGSYADIVSAHSKDKRYFDVGIFVLDKTVSPEQSDLAVLRFVERDGAPWLSKFVALRSGQMINVNFGPKSAKYKTCDAPHLAETDTVEDYIEQVIDSAVQTRTGFRMLPRGIGSNVPVPVVMSLVQTLSKNKRLTRSSLSSVYPNFINATWIAPIRTRPRRFYDGLRHSFSPEGEHTPFVLQKTLKSKGRSSNFAKKLQEFGRASGLFESVVTKALGSSPQAPFEILAKFSDSVINISNVGYGVSQVLPLIVEFLSEEKGQTFAVQQPEVHLHPRAQAALGDLLYYICADRAHSFVIETHSDFMIDRFRRSLAKAGGGVDAQVIFFSRTKAGNSAHVIPIQSNGRYPADQPGEFREFFINEDISLLDL